MRVIANSASGQVDFTPDSDITGSTVNEASELTFVTNLFGGEDYISVISEDDLTTDYSITIL